MLAPGCQSMSIRTKLSHSGPSITTMTGLVVAKQKAWLPLVQTASPLGFLRDWTAITQQLKGFLRNGGKSPLELHEVKVTAHYFGN